jgi:hypothetical protein
MYNSDIVITGPGTDLVRLASSLPRRWNIIEVRDTKAIGEEPPEIKRIHIPVCHTEEPGRHAKELHRKLKSMLPKISTKIDRSTLSVCLSIFATNFTDKYYTRNISLCEETLSVLSQFQCGVTVCVAPEQPAPRAGF